MNKIFLLQCHKEIQLDFQYNVWSLRQIQSPLLGVGLQGLREIQRMCYALCNNNPIITPCIQCDPFNTSSPFVDTLFPIFTGYHTHTVIT